MLHNMRVTSGVKSVGSDGTRLEEGNGAHDLVQHDDKRVGNLFDNLAMRATSCRPTSAGKIATETFHLCLCLFRNVTTLFHEAVEAPPLVV